MDKSRGLGMWRGVDQNRAAVGGARSVQSRARGGDCRAADVIPKQLQPSSSVPHAEGDEMRARSGVPDVYCQFFNRQLMKPQLEVLE